MTSQHDLTDAVWQKSTRSGGNGGQCVEVARLDGTVAVRDTKNRSGAILFFPASQWSQFIASAKDGEFDLTSDRLGISNSAAY
jgi:hypothetical protein